MAKASKKNSKTRSKKYDAPLAVKGNFMDVMKAAAKNANDKSEKKNKK